MLTMMSQFLPSHSITKINVVKIDNSVVSYYVDDIVDVTYEGDVFQFDTTGMGDLSMTGMAGDYTYVDLGLNSGLMWATCNVGAAKPTECGEYFAWGDVEPKNEYTDGSSRWFVDSNSSFPKYSKYCKTDSLLTLQAEDDAAAVNWGNGWRMPTHQDQLELVNGCTWKYVTDFNGSGAQGYLGTSKKNGKTIFLPTGGQKSGKSVSYADTYGYYLSSSLVGIDDGFAWQPHCLKTNNSAYQNSTPVNAGQRGQCSTDRSRGCNIRPCIEASYNANLCIKMSNKRTVTYDLSKVSKVTFEDVGKLGVTVSGREGDQTYVDLGLKSGKKWATCNIGAAKPADKGNYYAWGEFEEKNIYRERDYKFLVSDSLTKYCSDSTKGFVDNLIELDTEDDIATILWGNSWRMPTAEEMTELIDGCTWVWETNFNNRGIRGLLGTSKTNEATIFLPAGGRVEIGTIRNGSALGYYWTSIRDEENSLNAFSLYFYFSNTIEIKSMERYYGQFIRPILAK